MRSSISRTIQKLTRNDPFARYRDDDALARLVRETVSSTATPYTTLLTQVAGLAELDEAAARTLWMEGVLHRRKLSVLLERPVLLRVAILDLLSADPRFSRTASPALVPRGLLSSAVHSLTTDELTGLATRGHFVTILQHELRQRGGKLSIAFVDFDGFKAINDSQGHARGDEVLNVFGDVLKRTLRAGDVAARFGGDEFALLFPDSDLDTAEQVMNRIAAALYEAKFPVGLSVGLVQARPQDEALALLERADAAMYKKKRKGKRPEQAAVAKPVQRPLVIFASRNARLFFEVHTAFAKLGLPLLPAASPTVAALLVKLCAPRLLLADMMFPPGGGERLLQEHGAPVTCALLVPERFNRVRAPGPWKVLRMSRVPGELRASVAKNLFPGQSALSELTPLDSVEAGQALAKRVGLLCQTKGKIAGPVLAIDTRPELDFLRMHLGS